MTNIELKITRSKKFVLTVCDENPERFSDCSVKYIDDCNEIILEDYDFFYTFVVDIYTGVGNIHSLEESDLFGIMGQFQAFYLFDDDFIEEHKSKINSREKSSLFSTPTHSIFIYEFSGSLWLEINVDYENNPKVDVDIISPEEYFSNPENYRVLFTEISRDTISGWRQILKPYYDIVMRGF